MSQEQEWGVWGDTELLWQGLMQEEMPITRHPRAQHVEGSVTVSWKSARVGIKAVECGHELRGRMAQPPQLISSVTLGS